MTENPTDNDDLASEFKNLGESFVGLLESVWNRPERAKLQEEIESGLNDMAAQIREAAGQFSKSPTGQQMKSDVQDLREKVEAGEVEDKVRNDLSSILNKINNELGNLADKVNTAGRSAAGQKKEG